MKVQISRAELSNVIQLGVRGVSPRTTMPILSGVLMKVEDGDIEIMSTDLETSIRTRTSARVIEAGTAVVSARLMADTVKSLSCEEVTLETEDKYLVISTDMASYRIRGMETQDYPALKEWEEDGAVSIPAGDLSRAINQVIKASSNDDKRPILTSIHLDQSDGTLTLVATDSYRLAATTFPAAKMAGFENCTIPVDAMKEIARMLDSGAEEAKIRLVEKEVYFKTGDTLLTCRTVEGRYPEYQKFLPSGEGTKILVNRTALLEGLKRIQLFGHNARMEAGPAGLSLSTDTPEVGEASETMEAQVDGEAVVVGYNIRYATDGVSSFSGETVQLTVKDPKKPALMTCAEDEGFRYVLMPIRLSEQE